LYETVSDSLLTQWKSSHDSCFEFENHGQQKKKWRGWIEDIYKSFYPRGDGLASKRSKSIGHLLLLQRILELEKVFLVNLGREFEYVQDFWSLATANSPKVVANYF
jgi:hypothetical protein